MRLGVVCIVGIAFIGGSCCVAVPKISANCCSAAICLMPTWRKGAAGVGCFNAWIKSNAACVAASFDDVTGILTWWGKIPLPYQPFTSCAAQVHGELWDHRTEARNKVGFK
eukprot:1734026-Ditylum_brightwellii.AAC.1